MTKDHRIPWDSVASRRAIAHELAKRSITQRQIAAALGVSKGTVGSDLAAASAQIEPDEQDTQSADEAWINAVVGYLADLSRDDLLALLRRVPELGEPAETYEQVVYD